MLQARNAFVALTYISLIACPLAGKSLPEKGEPVSITATMSVHEFIRAHGKLQREAWPSGTTPRNTMVALPLIAIYSPNGEVVYSEGSDNPDQVARNLGVLRTFPSSVKDLKPVRYVPSLSSMLQIVPEFKATSDQILHDGHYVIYIASPLLTNRVIHTDEELLRIRADANHLKVDTLLVKLAM